MRTFEASCELVVKLLVADTHSLRELAKITERDPFTFYRGCQLINLDLSGQDLRGLNFDGADVRFSKLDNIQYDPGAFNRSVRDTTQSWIADDYNFDYEDLQSHSIDDVLIFCRIRPGLIDSVIRESDLTYKQFSGLSEVSESGVRKARNGGVVAYQTAYRVLQRFYSLAIGHSAVDQDLLNQVKQPCVEFLYGGNNKPFISLSRDKYVEVIDYRKRMIQVFLEQNPEGSVWRDTFEYIMFLKEVEDRTGVPHRWARQIYPNAPYSTNDYELAGADELIEPKPETNRSE